LLSWSPESEPSNAAKLESEPTVDDPEPEPEMGEPLVETSANLSAKLAMELVPLTPAVRVPVMLRSPDLCDYLHIFLHET